MSNRLARFPFIYLGLALGTALICSADNVTGTGQWESVSASQVSADIGWCTAGSSGCVVSTAAGTMSAYVGSGGSSASNISFVGSAQQSAISLSVNAANLGPGVDTVGFYVLSQAGTIASMVPMFTTASQNTNVLLSVSSGAQYGFYVENSQGQYYFTDSSLNSSKSGTSALVAGGGQSFSLYSSGNTDYVDFNNAITLAVNYSGSTSTVTPVPLGPTPAADPAPEPASTALACLGLGLLGFLAVRKRVYTRS